MDLLGLLFAGVIFSVNPFPLDALGTRSVAMVRGTVVQMPTLRPIAGAVVYAESREAGIETTVTDRRGQFYFLTLPPGHYGFFLDEHLFPLDCSVVERASELDAGYEYVATIYAGNGCRINR
jgi:hypothetical protein